MGTSNTSVLTDISVSENTSDNFEGVDDTSKILNTLKLEREKRIKLLKDAGTDSISYTDNNEDLDKELSNFSNNFVLQKFLKKSQVVNNTTFTSGTQQWLGHVIEITSTGFVAKLEDLSKGGTNEIGNFDLKEVSSEDIPLLKEGAAFYWSVGYTNNNGQTENKSFIRFQRLVKWTQTDYDESLDMADKLSQSLKWED